MQDTATIFLNAPVLKLFCKTTMKSTDTLGIFKRKIYEQFHIKPACQTIIYNGVVMGATRMKFHQVSAWDGKNVYIFDRSDEDIVLFLVVVCFCFCFSCSLVFLIPFCFVF